MDPLPLLYSFRRCPYAMRARFALLASGIRCVIREVALANKPSEMLAASPKGTVPVLVLPNGQVIAESLDIMRWALQQNDPEDWLASDRSDGPAVIAAFDSRFKLHLDRYKYPHRHDNDPIPHRQAGFAMLRDLDERLRTARYLHGDVPALTDMAIMPFIRQFAETDRGWFDAQPLGSLQNWLAGHLASPLFEQAMIRLKPWRAGDPLTMFPA